MLSSAVLVRVNVCVEDNDFGINLVINSTILNVSIAPLALIIRDCKCPDLQTTTKSQSPDSSHQLQSIFKMGAAEMLNTIDEQQTTMQGTLRLSHCSAIHLYCSMSIWEYERMLLG